MQKTRIAAEETAVEAESLDHTITLDEIENVAIRRGLDLWNEKRGPKQLPSRADMSPRTMSGFLRNTALVRVLSGGAEFEMRIVGDAIVLSQGASLQGMTMAEIDLVLPGYGTMLRGVYQRSCEAGKPLAYRGWFVREADGRSMYHESILLPLGDDGRTVDHLLVIGVYAMEPGQVLR